MTKTKTKNTLLRSGFVLFLSTALLLSGCKKSDSVTNTADSAPTKTLTEIVTDMIASQTDITNTELIDQSSTDFSDFYESRYNQTWAQGACEAAIAYSTEASADELSVFYLPSDSNSKQSSEDAASNLSANEFSSLMKTYLNDRCVSFNGYAPLEVAKLQKGVILTNGDYVAVIVCNDTDAAKKAFDDCFTNSVSTADTSSNSGNETTDLIGGSDGPTSIIVSDGNGLAESNTSSNDGTNSEGSDSALTNDGTNSEGSDSSVSGDGTSSGDSDHSGNTDNSVSTIAADAFEPGDELKAIAATMYDNSAIVAAYKAGDASSLTDEKQIAIYNKCVEVINENITDDMTDVEKETAIHDFMIKWADYDKEALKNEQTPSEDANNPYGFLIKQYGICSGYTTTFQLFMDLLDIPCLSIAGHSIFTGTGHAEDHAWNIAQIDGSWYYVDVTWDDPVGAGSDYITKTFLNCTTAIMQMTGHDWEKAQYPLVKAYYK